MSSSRLVITLTALLALVILANPAANGLPTRAPNSIPSTGATRTAPGGNYFSAGDYVSSESDFEDLLRRLREESENAAIRDDPRNYLGDNADMEHILALIRESENAVEQAESGTQTQTQTDQPGEVTTEETRPRTRSQSRQLSLPRQETTTRDYDDECPICYESKTLSSNHKLDCGHEFHQRCLVEWKRFVSMTGKVGVSCLFHLLTNPINPIETEPLADDQPRLPHVSTAQFFQVAILGLLMPDAQRKWNVVKLKSYRHVISAPVVVVVALHRRVLVSR